MARVYLARDLRYDKPVAVKVLNPELSAALGPERFLREIDILAHLNHPHILPLLDSGEADGSLFYVMPYVLGESLRHRLRRETQLPIADAIAIARDVAGALDYAHRQGVVHRDVKPENILMSEGLAIVADFGIARAITLAADDDRITQTGVSPGTPPYMSPEQASGDGVVDGRSDIYALGCVLYEMLAGQPPFTGPTKQAILARQLADPVPPLRTVRKTVSVGMEQSILKSLEKVPADRYATAGDFAEALAVPTTHGPTHPWWRRPAVVVPLVAAMAIAGVALFKVLAIYPSPAMTADSARYAILPFEREAGIPAFDEGQLLLDALERWKGIDVVDPFQIRDAMARHGTGRLSADAARAIAVGLGAGRYVRAQSIRVGDSIRVHAELYDTKRRVRLRDYAVKFPGNVVEPQAAMEALSDSLLFGRAGPGARLEGRSGTNSFPARKEFSRGLDSIYSWNLAAADSAFRAASEFDPEYAQAHLWLALVRFWSDTVTATWRSSAERAAAWRAHLAYRDQLVSDALVAFGRGDLPAACEAWQRLTAHEPYDFTGWYGLATCVSQDEAVFRDLGSPSGYRFRSSYNQAVKAYERAFELLPSIHTTLSTGSYAAVRRLLKASGGSARHGTLAGDTMSFVAHPSWLNDTLAFVPYPQRRMSEAAVVPADIALAVRHQRELFRDIATAWVTAFPRSAEAVEAQAIADDMLEDHSAAIMAIHQARALAKSDDQRARLAGTEVWMRVKAAAPLDQEGLKIARALADSLLSSLSMPTVTQPLLLASLAALTGRARLAAVLVRSPVATVGFGVPAPLNASGLPLLVFAAFGGPLDSLRVLEEQVDAAIDQHVDVADRQDARMSWLVRPARLAFPDYQFASLPKLVGTGDYLIGAEAAFQRRDTAAVLRVFAVVRAARRSAPASDVTLESLYPEARLLVALGDSQGAVSWLDDRLRALSATDPQDLVTPSNATALVRSMALRADLAARQGDWVSAKRWAVAVALLWSKSDPFLEPLVRRMRELEVQR